MKTINTALFAARMAQLPRDHAGLILGVHGVADYMLGPVRVNVTVCADPKGSMLPWFTVVHTLNGRSQYMGGQLSFPSHDDNLQFGRGGFR